MTSATKTSRKERERRGHRQEILSTALRLFAEKGFHDVSMQEIAAAAEFATGTLYNFFASKEDLFVELLEASATEVMSIVLPALEASGDERQRVARYIRLHKRIVREHAIPIRLFLLESRGRCVASLRVEEKKKEFHERVIRRLSEVIAAGVRKGLFNGIDPGIAARCLLATMESMILAAVENPQAGDFSADLKKVEAVFFKGLVKSAGGRRDA